MPPLPRAQSLPGQALVVGKPFDLAEVLCLIASQTTPQSAGGPLNRLSVAPQTRGAARNGELLRDRGAEDRSGRRPCWPARPSPISWRPSPAPDRGGAP
jgi:hypothetical protein